MFGHSRAPFCKHGKVVLLIVAGLIVLHVWSTTVTFPGTVQIMEIKLWESNSQVGKYQMSAYESPLFAMKSAKESDRLLYSHFSNITANCQKRVRFGTGGDGGYWICMDEPWGPTKNRCLVYDFGIRDEWTFDDDIHDRQGCEIHAFDPSMKANDHQRKKKLFFHKIGICDKTTVNSQGWKLYSLKDIIKVLGHEKRVIDILKIDIEGSEWPTLATMLNDDSTKNVKQMVFEIHGPKPPKYNMTVSDYAQVYGMMSGVQKKLGFRLWHKINVKFPWCCVFYSVINSKEVVKPHPADICCYELFYTNKLFEK